MSDGPYTCTRCTASTWNDDDLCDECRRPDPRDPDYSRENRQGRGTFFCYHNCYRCKDGELPCATKSGICQYPHARND